MRRAMMAVLAAACSLAFAQQAPDKPLIWYDNGQPRELWVDPDLMVEFDAPASISGRGTRSNMAPRVVKRSEAQGARSAPGKRHSPVLRDGPGGAMRALPGNILLQLDPRWTPAQVSSWLSAQGLSSATKLSFGKNVFMVQGEPGLESLELANRLNGEAGVSWAQPDWWQPLEPR